MDCVSLTVYVFVSLKELENLGKSLQQGSSIGKIGGVNIPQTLDSLSADWTKLEQQWASKKQYLEQGEELQRLNQEGDRIEAALSGHEARLRVNDIGVSHLFTWSVSLKFSH